MKIDMKPLLRRHVIQYAAKERLDFTTALECLVAEGIKAVARECPGKFNLVDKPVHKAV